ncbi:FAD-dependent oxidoreductase [Streptomyces sp. NPDC058475]|uniref:FAD-dependent oxidoreductase n=1 Tax=Streptomyces sp. NPDC058475 TaxID=3346518 RepID=UPI00365225FE
MHRGRRTLGALDEELLQMNPEGLPRPRHPGLAPPLLDNGLLRGSVCSPAERARTAATLAGLDRADAADVRLVSEMLGLTVSDLRAGRDLLARQKRMDAMPVVSASAGEAGRSDPCRCGLRPPVVDRRRAVTGSSSAHGRQRAGFPPPGGGRTRERVLVVGGGPAGVAAATVAARAGCRVVLAEATGYLGGQLAVAARSMPHRELWWSWLRRAMAELRRGAIEVRMNTLVRAQDVVGYDRVIIATGAYLWRSAAVTADGLVVLDAWTAIMRPAPLSAAVLVVDHEGEWSALDAAVVLASHGHAVTLATEAGAVGRGLHHREQVAYQLLLEQLGVNVLLHRAFVVGNAETRSVLRHMVSGEDRPLPAHLGAVVFAPARTPHSCLRSHVQGSPTITRVGDAVTPRTLEEAIAEGAQSGEARD